MGRTAPGVALVGLAAIALTGSCWAQAPMAAPPSRASLAGQATGEGMVDQITLICTVADGANVEQPERLCAEVADAFNASRPDLRFVAGCSGAPAARVLITRGNARGLGLDVTWTDAGGRRTAGRPLQVTFFDRASDAELRRNFYAVFLAENPIPF